MFRVISGRIYFQRQWVATIEAGVWETVKQDFCFELENHMPVADVDELVEAAARFSFEEEHDDVGPETGNFP